MRQTIKTDKAPAAIGPYSQGVKVKCGEVVFVSGMIPLNPETKEVVGRTGGEQCKQAMDNLSQVLKAAGADMTKIVKTTIFMTDLDDFGAINQMYSTYFDTDPPARAAVEVSRLPLGVKVMIEATAFL